MKIAVLYLKIVRRVESFPADPNTSYDAGHRRFLETYLRFRPVTPHDLLIVQCGGTDRLGDFGAVAKYWFRYDGAGADVGTYQAVLPVLDYDLVLCCNTLVHFWRPGWLEPIAEGYERHGPGVYGLTASNERNPHLRTTAIAISPQVMLRYPHRTSESATVTYPRNGLEAGPDNISLWAERAGYPVILVTADGRYYRDGWRIRPNIFRRGDQTNCLIFDRHTDIYERSSPEEKRRLERLADGA